MKVVVLNMRVLKKNQIIISVIALMLITAGYFNYIDNIESVQTVSNSIQELDEIAGIGDAKLVDAEAETNNSIYEDAIVENDSTDSPVNAEITDNSTDNTENSSEKDRENSISNNETKVDNTVSTGAENTDDYFASSRLERSNMYSEMIASYESMIANLNVSETQKGIATNEIYSINTTKNAIMICENLIKNKGFEDIVIFANNSSINVVVKAESLSTEQVAQIQNIISRELQAEVQNIHISYK